MLKSTVTSFLLVAGLFLPSAQADVLELKNGQILDGTFLAGSAGVIRFQTAGGMQVYAQSDVLSVTFTTPVNTVATTAPTVPPSTPAPAPTPATAPVEPASVKVTLNVGTPIMVQLFQPISSNDPAGTRFSGVLVGDLTSGQTVVAKSGSSVYGVVDSAKEGSYLRGGPAIRLRLTSVLINGKMVPLVSYDYAMAGSKSSPGKGAAKGAAIGAMAGDAGEGAGIGAAAGGFRRRHESVGLSSGALLQFTLSEPSTFTVSN